MITKKKTIIPQPSPAQPSQSLTTTLAPMHRHALIYARVNPNPNVSKFLDVYATKNPNMERKKNKE